MRSWAGTGGGLQRAHGHPVIPEAPDRLCLMTATVARLACITQLGDPLGDQYQSGTGWALGGLCRTRLTRVLGACVHRGRPANKTMTENNQTEGNMTASCDPGCERREYLW